jgi:hypothetical protein
MSFGGLPDLSPPKDAVRVGKVPASGGARAGFNPPSDGHTTADRPHLSAAKIIEHHNAIWSDFIAPGGGPAKICTCDAVVI